MLKDISFKSDIWFEMCKLKHKSKQGHFLSAKKQVLDYTITEQTAASMLFLSLHVFCMDHPLVKIMTLQRRAALALVF